MFGNLSAFVSFTEYRNDQSTAVGDWEHNVRSNLAKNDIALKSEKSPDAFNIRVFRSVHVTDDDEWGTRIYTAKCRSWFDVALPQQRDVADTRSYLENRGVGFSENAAVKKCHKISDGELAKGILYELQASANDLLKQPRTIYIEIENVDRLDESSEDIIDDIFTNMGQWDVDTNLLSFHGKTMRWGVKYTGDNASLIRKFKDDIVPLKLSRVELDTIAFAYPEKKAEPPHQDAKEGRIEVVPDMETQPLTPPVNKDARAANPKLRDCHSVLQDAVQYVYQRMDIRVFYCYRSESDQLKLKASGHSLLKKGNHNLLPSRALDAVVIKDGKIDWDDWDAHYAMNSLFLEWFGRVVEKNGCYKGFQLSLGINWRRPVDPYHVELIECTRGA